MNSILRLYYIGSPCGLRSSIKRFSGQIESNDSLTFHHVFSLISKVLRKKLEELKTCAVQLPTTSLEEMGLNSFSSVTLLSSSLLLFERRTATKVVFVLCSVVEFLLTIGDNLRWFSFRR